MRRRLKPSWLLYGLILTLPLSASPQGVYKWIDDQGNVHYGDEPAPGHAAEAVALPEQPSNAAVEAARKREEKIREQANELADQRIRLETERMKVAEQQRRELAVEERESRLRKLEEEAARRSNWSYGIPWYRPRPPYRPPGYRPPGHRPKPPVRPQALKPAPK